jgi:hypothetical protein
MTPGLSDFPDGDISYSVRYMAVIGEIPLTLTNIRRAYPKLFHRNQDWFEGEAFMDKIAEPIASLPVFEQWSFPYLFPKQDCQRVSAASLAWLYVQNPDAEIWNQYLWTDDLDSQNQRVYIGGKSNTGKLEIHRHIQITSRFGLPKW